MDKEKIEQLLLIARRGLSSRSSVGDRCGSGRGEGTVGGVIYHLAYQWSAAASGLRETLTVDEETVFNSAPHGHYVRL